MVRMFSISNGPINRSGSAPPQVDLSDSSTTSKVVGGYLPGTEKIG